MPQTTLTEEFRKQPPEALPPVQFSIPPFQTAELESGLKIVVFEDSRLPLVSFRLAFFTGDIDDAEGDHGLTSAMTAMLTEGTSRHSSREIAEKIERLGASVSANSSDDFIVIAASALSLYTSDILEILEEIVMQSNFPENELDLYKRNAIENLKFQRSQPGFLANEQTARLLYGEHPYSRVSPNQEEIERLDRESLVNERRTRLVPNNAILIVVGDIEKEEIVSEIRRRFHEWEAGSKTSKNLPTLPERSSRTLTIVDRPGSAQSNIVLANLAIDRNSPDYFPFLVMNQVLGAGASSRVFMNLREEKGYTYGAYTRFDAKRHAGDFEATAEVRTAVTGASLKEFFYELERIRAEKVSAAELADAKNFLTGVFPIRAETQEGLTNLLVTQFLYGLPEDYLQTYRDKVALVTIDDVERMAKKYVQPDKMAIVIVGDAEEILPQVREYAADIEILDTDGNPKDISAYENTGGGEAANVAGGWNLMIDFQGQQVPVSMTLVQSGETVTGSLETMLGAGQIDDGKISGNKLTASARTEIQGEAVEFTILGKVDGESMTGTLSAPIVPEPLSFTGTREAGTK
jgi:zinc protease